MTQLQAQVNSLETLVKDMSSQGKYSADKNSYEEVETFKWTISVDPLKIREHYSKPFYLSSSPFLLQMSAYIQGQRLQIWLYRCRGKNDTPAGKILTNFSKYKSLVYLVNASGNVFGSDSGFDKNDSHLNIGASYERSKGTGWDDFFKASTSNWNDWVINKHLHIFCKLEPLFY